jgi:hypothetical protein
LEQLMWREKLRLPNDVFIQYKTGLVLIVWILLFGQTVDRYFMPLPVHYYWSFGLRSWSIVRSSGQIRRMTYHTTCDILCSDIQSANNSLV